MQYDSLIYYAWYVLLSCVSSTFVNDVHVVVLCVPFSACRYVVQVSIARCNVLSVTTRRVFDLIGTVTMIRTTLLVMVYDDVR